MHNAGILWEHFWIITQYLYDFFYTFLGIKSFITQGNVLAHSFNLSPVLQLIKWFFSFQCSLFCIPFSASRPLSDGQQTCNYCDQTTPTNQPVIITTKRRTHPLRPKEDCERCPASVNKGGLQVFRGLPPVFYRVKLCPELTTARPVAVVLAMWAPSQSSCEYNHKHNLFTWALQ